jgi:LytS/YehU family sensor histidine kinase
MGLSDSFLQVMRKVDSTFTSVTEQSISFIGKDGTSIFPFNFRLFTDFCGQIINSPKGSVECMDCNRFFIKNRQVNASVIKCHIGLTMMSVPIIVDGKSDYAITSGQILCEDNVEEFYSNLEHNAAKLDLDYEMLKTSARMLKILTHAEILSRVQFLSVLAEYISVSETQLQLRNKYLEELEQKIRVEKKLKEIEFGFLESQIKPHFLFNTLNLLARTAIRENAGKTAELIYDLADLLRWGFKTKESVCTLEEEFKHVNSYLDIQKTRLGTGLEVETFLEPGIAKCTIPVLTIQPIVENAIIHGVEGISHQATLTVMAESDADHIVITVTDTGEGMGGETVNKIRNYQTTGIGLKNVQERLALFYGNKFSFNIHSIPGKGTKVCIKVAKWIGDACNADVADCRR